MLTLPELTKVIYEHYTVEELVDILEISSAQLCDAFEELIIEEQDELLRRVREDLGYGGEEDED